MIPARYPRSLPTKHDNCSLAPHPARPDFSPAVLPGTRCPTNAHRGGAGPARAPSWGTGGRRSPRSAARVKRKGRVRRPQGRPASHARGDGRRTPARPSCSRLRAVVGVCRTGVETDVRRAARGRWGHWCSRRARLPDAAGAPGGNARRNWRSGTRDRAGGLHERADGGAPPDPGLPKTRCAFEGGTSLPLPTHVSSGVASMPAARPDPRRR